MIFFLIFFINCGACQSKQQNPLHKKEEIETTYEMLQSQLLVVENDIKHIIEQIKEKIKFLQNNFELKDPNKFMQSYNHQFSVFYSELLENIGLFFDGINYSNVFSNDLKNYKMRKINFMNFIYTITGKWIKFLLTIYF